MNTIFGTLSNLSDISSLEKFPKNLKSSVIELYLNNHKIKDISCLSDFTELENVIMPCNPYLHSLNGLENKKKLLYLAAQQPAMNESNIGFEDLNGLSGSTSLLTVILFNNKNLQNISMLKNSTNLNTLSATNCDILSTDGLQGKDGNGLDKLYYLYLENNINLTSVENISKCDGIRYLYLAGCNNMIDSEAIKLETIISKCGKNYSIPQKYSLKFASVTSQDISGSEYTNNQLENLKGATNIIRLRLKNCTSLSNDTINDVLSTMTGIKYLSLEGTTGLSSISFVDNMNLIELDISGTSVSDLSPLNDDSSKSLKSLRLISTNINNYQKLLENLFNATSAKNSGDGNFWQSGYSFNWEGLMLLNSGVTIKLPSGIEKFSLGSSGGANTYDLSSCNHLLSAYVSNSISSFIFPSSLKSMIQEVGSPANYDFSRCLNLESLTFLSNGNEEWSNRVLKTLPENNILNYLEFRRSKFSDLNFLKGLHLPKIESLIIQGWSSSNSINTNLISTDGVQFVTSLKKLYLRYSYLKDLTGLDSLTNLTTLDLQYNRLDSSSQVSNIASCTKITELYLNNNQISTISFLSNLVALKTANLSNNSFSQIPELSKLIVLNSLDISNCLNITNLQSLETVIKVDETTSLKILNLQGCSSIENVSSTTGYDNKNLIDRLKKAGCTSITTTGTRL